MKKIRAFLLLIMMFYLFGAVMTINAQTVSFGVKIGASLIEGEFGSNYGAEASLLLNSHTDQPFGIYLGYDRVSQIESSRFFIGAGTNIEGFGLVIGPSFMSGGHKQIGLSMSAYAGEYIFPYYEFTYYKKFLMHSGGVYLKYPTSGNYGTNPIR